MLLSFVVLVVGTGCTETVNPGEVGVAVDWGETQSWVYPEGFHWVSPWVDVIHMSTRTQAYEMGSSGTPGARSGAESTLERGESISVLTQDQLSVTLSATVQFHLDATTAPIIYRMYGVTYADTLVHPLVRTAIRDAASSFSAIQLVDDRTRLQAQMERNVLSQLEETLHGRGIPIRAVVIENILLQDLDLPETLDESIAAVQRQRQATSQSEQALLTARAESERLQTEATGEAAALRIRAEGQAAANRLLAESMTPAILELRRIEATTAILRDGGTRTVMVPSTGLTLMMPSE
ncbi:MAG: prohibitin family protein [Myxococcota bacterium]|nr:prohibitin family protein [Myxococcota bacterium]